MTKTEEIKKLKNQLNEQISFSTLLNKENKYFRMKIIGLKSDVDGLNKALKDKGYHKEISSDDYTLRLKESRDSLKVDVERLERSVLTLVEKLT